MKNFKFIITLALFLTYISFVLAQDQSDENKDDSSDQSNDYQDYEYESAREQEQDSTFMQKVALTRDWFGRKNPNETPAYGFFPAWPALLLIISSFCFVMAIVTGLLHVLGCKGKRPVAEKKPLIETNKQ